MNHPRKMFTKFNQIQLSLLIFSLSHKYLAYECFTFEDFLPALNYFETSILTVTFAPKF